MRERWPLHALLGAIGLLAIQPISLGAAAPSHGDPVPADIQALVEDELGRMLVQPETARWDFQSIRPYPGGGKIVCGTLDYQDSARKYRGPHRFFATLYGRVPKVAKMALESNGPTRNRSLDFDFSALCDRD